MRKLAFAIAMATPMVAGAQQVVSSSRMAGTADVLGASARGAEALAVNPALLGAGDTGQWSIVTGAPLLSWRANPITMADIAKYGGKTLPDAVKQDWLSRVSSNGAQEAAADLSATALAVSWHGIAASLSAVGGATSSLPRDGVAMLLYGNTNPDGTPAARSFSDGSARGYGAALVTVGAGHRLGQVHWFGSNATLYGGASVKAMVAGGYAEVWGLSGQTTTQPVSASLNFPTLKSHKSLTGVGMDLGFAAVSDAWTLSAAVSDLVNAFTLNASNAYVSPGSASVTQGGATASAPDIPANSSGIPAALASDAHQRVDDAQFARTVRVDGSWRARPDLTLAADVRAGAGGGLQRLAAFSAGIGAEWGWKPWLPLRAGVRSTRDGASGAIGAGLRAGLWELDGSTGIESTPAGTAPVFGVSLSWGLAGH